MNVLPLHADSRGFTVIEVIVAISLIAVVISGGAVAAVGTERAQQTVATQSNAESVARKALERAQSDSQSYATCTASQWRAATTQALQEANSGSTTAASFPTCTFTYAAMRDQDGRQYTARVSVRPVDTDRDGIARADTDRMLLDRFDATVTAQVDTAAGSAIGLNERATTPAVLEGTLDWSTYKGTVLGSVRVFVCKIPRTERGIEVSACPTDGTPNRGPVATTVTLLAAPDTEYSPQTISATSSASTGIALFSGNVLPGRYTVSVTAPPGMLPAEANNRSIMVTDTGTMDVYATLQTDASETTICTQTINPPSNNFGYETSRTTLTMRRTGNSAHQVLGVRIGEYNAWSCTVDPGTTTAYFQDTLNRPNASKIGPGSYDFQVAQDYGAQGAGMELRGYYVRNGSTSTACTSGTTPSGTQIVQRFWNPLDRALISGEDANWYGTYKLADTTPKVMCLQFYNRPIERTQCSTASQYPGCTQTGTTPVTTTTCSPNYTPYGTAPCPSGANLCTANCSPVTTTTCSPNYTPYGTAPCPNGASLCTANCSGSPPPPGWPTGPLNTNLNTMFAGGPNDTVVACKNPYWRWAWAAPYTYNRANTKFYGFGQTSRGTWDAYAYVGTFATGWGPPAGPVEPRNADGSVYWCDEVGFTVSNSNWWSMRGKCIRVTWNGRWVQGKIMDSAPDLPSGRIMPWIGAWRELLYDVPAVRDDYWGYYISALGNPTTYWQEVVGDPTCSTGSLSQPPVTPTYQWFNPISTTTTTFNPTMTWFNAIWTTVTTQVPVYHVPLDQADMTNPPIPSPPNNTGSFTNAV